MSRAKRKRLFVTVRIIFVVREISYLSASMSAPCSISLLPFLAMSAMQMTRRPASFASWSAKIPVVEDADPFSLAILKRLQVPTSPDSNPFPWPWSLVLRYTVQAFSPDILWYLRSAELL